MLRPQRVHGEPNAVSQPACEHSPILAIRVEHEYGRPIGLVAPRALHQLGLVVPHMFSCSARTQDRSDYDKVRYRGKAGRSAEGL
jgi:hypothetical protein